MTKEERKKAIDALKISAPIMAVTQEEFNDYIQTLNKVMDWLEQEPCDDWCNVLSDKMTLEQARQAVKDLRKKLAECLWQEPCDDCISRQEVLDYLDKMPSELTSDGRRMVRRRMLEEYISDTLPPVTPQQKIGHWINAYPDIEPNSMFMYGICSVCGFEQSISDKLNYCPNCGVKMQEVEG